MTMLIRGTEPLSVFSLNGTGENSATYALGWVLNNSPTFLQMMLGAWLGSERKIFDPRIVLQNHGEDGGYTDIEITSPDGLHVIVEAKKSWDVPSEAQLLRYHPRFSSDPFSELRIVSISGSDSKSADRKLPRILNGVEVVHQSWREIRAVAAKALSRTAAFQEKLWLRQLDQHLREFVAVDRLTDNTVYVVSLSSQEIAQGAQYTWIDVVERDCCYFHPVGLGWPVQPPNYIGFRYTGKLQSVHHIDAFEAVENLSSVNKAWPNTITTHFIYRLGPPMKPSSTIRTGNIFRNGRVYCAIDTLLSGAFATISEARDETKLRLSLTE